MMIIISVSKKEKERHEESPYFHALIAAGAKPEELQLVTHDDAIQVRPRGVNGLLLTGGADIDPSSYDEQKKYDNVHIDEKRDKFEFSLLGRAIEYRLPVLAICRGAQLANVQFKGTLYQDLEKQWVPENENARPVCHKQAGNRSEATHTVVVTDPQSRLGQVLRGSYKVNSLHHQGIKRPGHGIRITAHAEDGLVEAFETADRDAYLVAVQWHPEELIHSPEQRALFEQFLGECRKQGTGNRE
jgi:putative glutamine amidotransferase